MPERLRSLRARLLLALMVPLVLLVAAGAVLDYRALVSMAQASHDRALAGLAIGLAARLETDRDSDMPTHLVAMMRTMNRFTPEDRLYYLVLDEQGQTIAGDPVLGPLTRLATAPQAQNPALADARLAQQPVRTAVYAYVGPEGRATIVVAETLRRQAAEVRRALVGSLLTNAATAVAVALGALLAVGVALAPLHALGERLEGHEAHELRPLRLRSVPAEVLPLVRALNRLMRRLRRAVQARQAFIHNTAHQLRTPLAGLSAQAQLLQ